MISIGIDLGTANSAIAYFDGKEAKVIPNIYGETTIPSRVIWKENGSFFVGREAMNHPEKYDCENYTIGSIKRRMEEIGGVTICGKRHYPQIVSALILSRLKKQAEVFLKTTIEEAVISIPCNFGVLQRYSTIEAAEMAGFKVLHIINEATAAALAFSYSSRNICQDNEIVFDMGAGTLDLSLIEYAQGVLEVKAIEGEEFLGGDDFDEIIIKWIVDETKKTQGFDPIEDQQFKWHHIAALRLREAAEYAKIELSSQKKTRIYIPYIRNLLGNPQHIDLELTEDKFEDLCQGLVKTAVNQIALISSQGKLVEKEIEREIRKMVPDPDSLRYRDKWKFWKKMPEKEVVNRVKEKVLARDGVVPSKIVFTGGACKIRCLRNKLMSTYAGSTFIFREKELVAKGAAIKAGIIKGICKDTLVLECTSKSIGLVLQGGVYDKIIHKNTTIPTKKTKTFTTTEDNQKYINISVFEGDHEIVSSNRKVIDLKCGPLLPAKAGIPKVKVVFDVDASNVLRVVAEDMGTGKSLEVVDSDAPYTHLDSKMKKKIKDLLENWSSKV